jgi:hypothetical protein
MAPRLKVLLLASPPPNFWVEEVLKLIAHRHQVVPFDPEADPAPQFQEVDAVLDMGGPRDKRPLADLAGSVKLWQLVSTGFDTFDVDYWRERQIPVANTPGGSSAVALAECALMLMIMVPPLAGIPGSSPGSGGGQTQGAGPGKPAVGPGGLRGQRHRAGPAGQKLCHEDIGH